MLNESLSFRGGGTPKGGSAAAAFARGAANPRLRPCRLGTEATPPLPARSPLAPPSSQSGFTLAGLIVVLTILMIVVAFTVPTQWSRIMQRERERQTIFVMKQYARAIREWQKKNGAVPVKLDQLKEARLPRMMRGVKGELANPLTGKMDWILIPPGAVSATGAQMPTPGVQQGSGPTPTTSSGTQGGTQGAGNQNNNRGTTFNAAASPKDYVGPFIGVRPPNSGASMMTFNGSDDYSQWYYTTIDLDLEIQRATMVNPNARP